MAGYAAIGAGANINRPGRRIRRPVIAAAVVAGVLLGVLVAVVTWPNNTAVNRSGFPALRPLPSGKSLQPVNVYRVIKSEPAGSATQGHRALTDPRNGTHWLVAHKPVIQLHALNATIAPVGAVQWQVRIFAPNPAGFDNPDQSRHRGFQYVAGLNGTVLDLNAYTRTADGTDFLVMAPSERVAIRAATEWTDQVRLVSRDNGDYQVTSLSAG